MIKMKNILLKKAELSQNMLVLIILIVLLVSLVIVAIVKAGENVLIVPS